MILLLYWNDRTKEMQGDQKIQYTYLTGRLSATLIIPIQVARKHGLNKPSNVIVEETENGILIKRKSKGV